MSFSIVNADETWTLNLEDKWTIERAGELREALIDLLARGERLALDLSEVSEADVCTLQLLCSAHKTALKEGKSLIVVGRESEALLRLRADAGYGRHFGCHNDLGKNCLWMEDGNENHYDRG